MALAQSEVLWVNARHLPLYGWCPASLSSQFAVTAALWMHSIWMPGKMLWVQGWKESIMP